MGYTETEKDGVITRTYSDGRTETRSAFGDDKEVVRRSASGSVTSVTDTSKKSTSGGGREALTEEQVALEQKRIQEEIAEYGGYTPLQYEDGKYYQTAPTLSPSVYLQPPDSEEGKRIIASHPAGEKAYEPSGQWITPTQARAQLEAQVASGEVQKSSIGYMDIYTVRGESEFGLPSGSASYTKEQAIASLIRKEPLQPPGESPERPVLLTSSLISDMIYEGYANYEEVRGQGGELVGFNLNLTPAGEQMKGRFLPVLEKARPEDWLITGSSAQLQFRGMPYTITTIEEPGKKTTVTTDFFGKVMGQETLLFGENLAGKPAAPVKAVDYSDMMGRLGTGAAPMGIEVLPVKTAQGTQVFYKSFSLTEKPKLEITAPGVKEADAKARAFETTLTGIDKAIEQSILGEPKRAVQKGIEGFEGLGRWIRETRKSPLLIGQSSMQANLALGQVGVGVLTSPFVKTFATEFSTIPETGMKLATRAVLIPAGGVGLAMGRGPAVEFMQQGVKLYSGYGVAIGAMAVGEAGAWVSNPIEAYITKAPAYGRAIATDIAPRMGAWAFAAGVTSTAGAELAKMRTPKEAFVFQEEVGGTGKFQTYGRFKYDVMGKEIYGPKFQFVGKAVQEGDDVFYGAVGRTQGQPYTYGQVGAMRVGKEFEMLGSSLRPFRGDAYGFALAPVPGGEMRIALGNIPGQVTKSAYGEPLYFQPSRAALEVKGAGYPFRGVTGGVMYQLTPAEQAMYGPVISQDVRAVFGRDLSSTQSITLYGAKSLTAVGETITPMTVKGVIVQTKIPVSVRPPAGEYGLSFVGPSAGGYGGGGTAMVSAIKTTPVLPVAQIGAEVQAAGAISSFGTGLGNVLRGVGVTSLTKQEVVQVTPIAPKVAMAPMVQVKEAAVPKVTVGLAPIVKVSTEQGVGSAVSLKMSQVQAETTAVKPKISLSPVLIQATPQRRAVIQTPSQLEGAGQDVGIGVMQIGLQKVKLKETTVTSTSAVGFVPPIPVPPPPVPIVPIDFQLGNLSFGMAKGAQKFNTQPRKYTPSTTAILMDIRVKKEPGKKVVFTGGEIRPIVEPKLPKAKKKKGPWWFF